MQCERRRSSGQGPTLLELVLPREAGLLGQVVCQFGVATVWFVSARPTPLLLQAFIHRSPKAARR